MAAHADYHTVLLGARLHLSTTTIQAAVSFSTKTENGFTQIYSSQKGSIYRMPSDVVEGYLARISADPPISISSTTALNMKGDNVLFYFASELIRLKYPREALANTRTLQGVFIPRSIIASVERLQLPFDGDAGMGEPFFVPEWQATLMSKEPPVFSCAPPTEQGNIVFISYNREVTEKDFSPLCATAEYDPSLFAPLVKKGNVFAVAYPAD